MKNRDKRIKASDVFFNLDKNIYFTVKNGDKEEGEFHKRDK